MPLGLGLCGTCCTTCACTLDGIANQVGLCGNTLPSVSLTGISATGSTNPIVITATSSNTAILANPTVNYTSPNTTGSLTLNWAGGNGSVLITVKVTSTGCQPITRSATFSLNRTCGPPAIDQAPPISLAHDSGTHNVTLTGITIGPNQGCGGTNIQVVVGQTSPPVLFNNPSVIYTYPNTTATLVLPVALGTVGTGKLTVQLVSNGFAQTGGPCNIAVAYMNIDVTVF